MIKSINDLNLNKKNSLIYYINNKLEKNKNKKNNGNIKDQEFNYKQNQKTLYISNIKYYSLSNNL